MKYRTQESVIRLKCVHSFRRSFNYKLTKYQFLCCHLSTRNPISFIKSLAIVPICQMPPHKPWGYSCSTTDLSKRKNYPSTLVSTRWRPSIILLFLIEWYSTSTKIIWPTTFLKITIVWDNKSLICKFSKGLHLYQNAVSELPTAMSGWGTHHVHLQIQSQGLEIPQLF